MKDTKLVNKLSDLSCQLFHVSSSHCSCNKKVDVRSEQQLTKRRNENQDETVMVYKRSASPVVIEKHYRTWVETDGFCHFLNLKSPPTRKFVVLKTGKSPVLYLMSQQHQQIQHAEAQVPLCLQTKIRLKHNNKTIYVKNRKKKKCYLKFVSVQLAEYWMGLFQRVLEHSQWLCGLDMICRIVVSGENKVYKCKHKRMKSNLALKVVQGSIEDNKEANILTRLTSMPSNSRTNYFQYYRIFESSSTISILMPLYMGNLLNELKKRGRFSLKDSASVLFQIAKIMREFHKGGIIHCDLKLENIALIDSNCLSVRVIDFGGAVCIADGQCAPNRIVGTPGYISPERLDGNFPTPASDVFSLGIIAYQLIFGKHPYTTTDRTLTLNNTSVYDENILSCSDTASIPVDVKDLVRRMINRNPKDRISVEEILGYTSVIAH